LKRPIPEVVVQKPEKPSKPKIKSLNTIIQEGKVSIAIKNSILNKVVQNNIKTNIKENIKDKVMSDANKLSNLDQVLE